MLCGVLKITGYPILCNITLLGITREDILNGTKTEYNKKCIHSSLEDKSVTVNYTVSNISPQLNYIFIADILDYFKMSRMSHSLVSFFYLKLIFFITNIATYHVQGLTLQYYSDNGSVVVECRFAERSTADGCHVIFRESSKGRTMKSIIMSKPSIEESTIYQYITLLVSGNYTVTGHDIVDGTITTNPSVVYPQILEYICYYHLLLRLLLLLLVSIILYCLCCSIIIS